MSARKILKNIAWTNNFVELVSPNDRQKKIRHGAINVGSGYKGKGQINSNGDKIDLACRKEKSQKPG